jgi:hypothetical protein
MRRLVIVALVALGLWLLIAVVAGLYFAADGATEGSHP